MSPAAPAAAPPVPGVSGDVARLVRSTVLTALAGIRDVGGEVGQLAAGVVRGSLRAAGAIGAEVIGAADLLAGAAGRAAGALVGPAPAARTAGRRREAWGSAPVREGTASDDTLPARPDAYAQRPAPLPAGPPRKPLARSPGRARRPAAAKRRRPRAI